MNVKQLIRCLKEFDDDSEVMITWKGKLHDIDPNDIFKVPNGVVLLDGECYSAYRRCFNAGEEGYIPGEVDTV